ncbi:YbaB/EbfC family nucleoid-associated protein [Gulosibacter bifidus]|uniref:YbaB/EbfC family nucleoid-associated protein n=1 Tax=Gulosibacter bifidus TaxID=272239 RepID=A0ABW5RH60_9MICO|nr:YbaB/EbfC family nucleoid-associated protein [Gulosibacter bifidus]
MTSADNQLFNDPEAMRRRVAEQIEQAQQRAEKMTDFTDRLKALEAEATTPHDDVWVRVNSAGLLLDIAFSDRALEGTADQLSAMVKQVYQDAQRKVAQAAVEFAQQEMGDDIAGRMRGDYESRLGELDEDDDTDDYRDGLRGMQWNR